MDKEKVINILKENNVRLVFRFNEVDELSFPCGFCENEKASILYDLYREEINEISFKEWKDFDKHIH